MNQNNGFMLREGRRREGEKFKGMCACVCGKGSVRINDCPKLGEMQVLKERKN